MPFLALQYSLSDSNSLYQPVVPLIMGIWNQYNILYFAHFKNLKVWMLRMRVKCPLWKTLITTKIIDRFLKIRCLLSSATWFVVKLCFCDRLALRSGHGSVWYIRARFVLNRHGTVYIPFHSISQWIFWPFLKLSSNQFDFWVLSYT